MKKILISLFLLILFFFNISSCGMLPGTGKANFNLSKGDKIDGGGKGTYGVGEAKASLNFSDNNSKNYERSNIKSKDTSNQLKSSQDKTKFSIGGKHTDLSKNMLKNDTRNNTADDYISGDQKNNIYNSGIDSFDLFLIILISVLLPSPFSQIYRAIKTRIINFISNKKRRNNK